MKTTLVALLLLTVTTAQAAETGERRKSRRSAVAALRPGPLPAPPAECGPQPVMYSCLAEAIATAPSCDGFIGDPLFLYWGLRGAGTAYCRLAAPPADYEAWKQAHPESCRPGETRHGCVVALRRNAPALCPEFDGHPDFYRVYPLTAQGGHKGLEPRPDEHFPWDTLVERSFCRRLEAIQAEEAAAKRAAEELFHKELRRNLAIGAGVLAALLGVGFLIRRAA